MTKQQTPMQDDLIDEVEEEKRWKEINAERILIIGMPYETHYDGTMSVWDGHEVLRSMKRAFDAAQETVCINGKEQLIYKSFDNWLEWYKQKRQEEKKQLL